MARSRLLQKNLIGKLHVTGMSAVLLLSSKSADPRSCWELRRAPDDCVFHLSVTAAQASYTCPADSRRLARWVLRPKCAGGDKTDTPTDMLHKEAQVAFKILMTH